MSHEHEAVYLAVASLDFELSPDERRAHGSRARGMSRMRRDRRQPQRPGTPARPATRPRRVARCATTCHAGGPRPAPTHEPLAGPARRRGAARPDDRGRRSGGRLPRTLTARCQRRHAVRSLPALGDVESPLPSSSAGPVSSQDLSGPGFGAPLTPDTIAEVVSGRLRIRSEPRVAADSIKHEPLLDVGDRLLVLDGPVVASDYEWYQVMAWRPGNLYDSWPVGWVSRGDHDGSPWIRPSADPCPTGAVTMDIVEALHPQERVACFGDRPLRLRAFVSGEAATGPCVPEPATACVDGPAWLTGSGGWLSARGHQVATPSIGGPPLAIDPDGPVPASALPAGPWSISKAPSITRPRRMPPGCQRSGRPARRSCRRPPRVPDALRRDERQGGPDYPVARDPGVTVSPTSVSARNPA